MLHSPSETRFRLDNVNRLMAKRDSNRGLAIGFHGTSSSRALHIIEHGFENRVPERGGFRDVSGVYFWDEEYKNNALLHGEDRAVEDGDDQLAVIEAGLTNPAPDYEQFRPQWRANSENVGLIAVRFYDLADRREVQVINLDAGSTLIR